MNTLQSVAIVFLAISLPLTAEEKGKWIPISESVTSKVKPGWPGLTAGVTVDPASGDVFMVIPDQGIWRSSDHGQTFERADKGEVGGRCETGYALNFDPGGKRLMCFMIYGNSALTTDGGKTWTKLATSHLDFGAVDWDATGKTMVALRHEAGGVLCISHDAGQTWKDHDKGFTAVGVFDPQTLLASKGKGILRSTDAGATWTQVSDITPNAALMLTLKDGGYWATSQGILVSNDKGATWSVLGNAINASFGPYFGKSASHFVVVGKDGTINVLHPDQSPLLDDNGQPRKFESIAAAMDHADQNYPS